MLLHIALQDGLANDTVVIRSNGQEIYRKTGVSTRTQLAMPIWLNLTCTRAVTRSQLPSPRGHV